MANGKKRENFLGFQRVYLEGEVEKILVARHWDELGNALALFIYGLVLFPTFEDFIDLAAISIFWVIWKEKESLVYPFLADTFRTLHVRHEKKSVALKFCFALLFKWLTSHVFKPNAPISEITSREWARTLVSLSGKDITSYHHKLNVEEIIVSCDSFPNVPLIGFKGCISYNPMLAL